MSIDTLSIANRLKAAEREGRAAEEIALVLRDIDEERYARLVTREMFEAEAERVRAEFEKVRLEVENVRAEMRAGFDKGRLELEKLKVELRHDLTLRLGAMIAAAAAVLGGLNVFF